MISVLFRIVQGNIYNMRIYLVIAIKLELSGVRSRHLQCKIMPRRSWMIIHIWNHWFGVFHIQMWKSCPFPKRLFYLCVKPSNYFKHPVTNLSRDAFQERNKVRQERGKQYGCTAAVPIRTCMNPKSATECDVHGGSTSRLNTFVHLQPCTQDISGAAHVRVAYK